MKLRLTQSEAELLVAMRLEVRADLPRVAKLLKTKEHKVRYALTSLAQRGITRPYALINLSSLGYTEYDVSCSIMPRSEAERRKFFDYLVKMSCTTEVLEAGGEYHALFTIAAKSPMEVDKVLQLLSAKFGSSLAEVRIATCLNYSIFPPKYLAPSKPVLRSEVTVTHNGFDRSLDDKDHSLLRCLAELPDASFRDQSRTLGWASSTFDARLKALTSCGVFNGYIWLIHPGMYGHESFRIYIALRSISAQVKQAIYQFSHTHPYVTYHIEWLGDWHLCLGAIAPHVGEACRLVNEIHDRFGQFLARVTLVPILADHKIQIAPTKH